MNAKNYNLNEISYINNELCFKIILVRGDKMCERNLKLTLSYFNSLSVVEQVRK